MYKIYPGLTRYTTVIFIPYIYFSQPSTVSGVAGVAGGFLYTFHHDNKVTPFHRITAELFIIGGNLKTTGFKPLYVHHQAAVLGMEKLHQLTTTTDEDEHVTILDTASHTFMHHTAKGTDALAHISPARAKIIAHRIIQTEHGSSYIG